MIKPSVRFSFLLALALVSFLFQGTVTTSASLSSSSNTAEPAVSKPFKPVLMSSLARKVDENTQRIALLDNDLDSLLTINFIVSRDLLAEIVPYNEEEVIFVLSGTPSLSTLSKLIFVLNANINRLDMISTVIRQYSHYDQISERMFQNVKSYTGLFILFYFIFTFTFRLLKLLLHLAVFIIPLECSVSLIFTKTFY